jgi:uncharacterized protein YjiK
LFTAHLIMMTTLHRLLLIVAIPALCCNNQEKPESESPKGYQLLDGKKIELPASLKEISGIAFFPNSDSLLMAVNDEQGKLFSIDFYKDSLIGDPIDFGKKGDYEDLAFFSGRWMVLESNGTLHWVLPKGGKKGTQTFSVLPTGEYEGMSAVGDTLFVLCKDCKDEIALETTVHKLIFEGDSLSYVCRSVLRGVKKDAGPNQKLLPSAIAFHPLDKHWFILSHNNAWLMVTDINFQVLERVPLKRSLFEQPEGIAFNSRGDMFISSEGKKGKGYIMKFEYKKD